MSFIQNLFTSRDNNAQGNTFVGQQDRIWWNPDTNAFYYSDGNTAGGIPIGFSGSGNGLPGGPTNSVQINNGAGNFTGSTNLTFSGNVLNVGGNVVASYFIGNVDTTGNIVGGNILSDSYLYANGDSIFANTVFSGNIELGNLYVIDQTIGGKINDRDISISPEGNGTLRTLNGIGIYQGSYLGTPLFSVSTTGVVSTLVPNAVSYLGAFEVIGNPAGNTVAPQNYGVMIHTTGVPSTPARIYNDGVNAYGAIVNRRYNGTSTGPTGVLANQIMGRVAATPYLDNGGVGEWPAISTCRVDFIATEDQTTTGQGSKIQILATQPGESTPTVVADLAPDDIILHGNLYPAENNTFNLGNATLKWANVYIGPNSIFIEDTTLGTDAELQVDNGVFYSLGVSAFQVGNMQMTTDGLRLTTASTGSDINIGELTDTGYMHVQMPGIKFKDNTIQTTAAIPLAQKGNALGVVPLNASTKIDPIYLPAGGINFLGIWNAANNTPTLADGVGNIGDEYIVGVGGTQDLGSGNVTFAVGDFVLYTAGNVWADIPVGGTGVSSFNSRTGVVTLLSSDVTNALSNGSITNNYLATDSWDLTLGQGLGLTGNATVELGDSITLTNTGVIAAIGGTGVGVSAATGNVTISIGQPVGTGNSVQFLAVSATQTVQATGNVTGGNLVTGGRVVATGNIVTTGYLLTPNTSINNGIVTTGNITGGNLSITSAATAVTVTATGNVIGGNLVGQNLTAGRVAIVGSGKEITTDADFTYNSTTNVLTVNGNVNANYFNGNIVSTGNITTTGNVIGNYGIFTNGNTVINAGVTTTGNVTGNYFVGNGSQLTGVITTILPTTLSSTVHIAADTVGNTATIITDATTATVANTIVVRDSTGGINVSNWSINARTTATSITLTTTDYWIGCTAKNLTITLPNAANGAVQGRQYLVVDCVQSGAPGDTIATQAGATVVGGSLSQQGQSKTCVFIAATNTWYCN
jgi:hypothetical protein